MHKTTDLEKKEIIERYRLGQRQCLIAREMGLHRIVVHRITSQLPDRRPLYSDSRKYSIDESVFDILNEESAYWTGFIMADGHVRDGKKITLRIRASDIVHLRKLVAFLKSDIPITLHESTSPITFPTKTFVCSLVFYSKRIYGVLKTYGIIHKKSMNKGVIFLELDRHFWRGIIDGDGTVARSNATGRPEMSLVGNKEIVYQFLDFVKHHCPPCRATPKPKKNIWCIRITGEIALHIIKLMYMGCDIALDRKNEIASEIISNGYVTKYRPRKAYTFINSATQR